MLLRPDAWKSLRSRYEDPNRSHRMLALDGGGIRGLITLGILSKIEKLVRAKTGLRMCEYFDYIAGTSTGAIIAAGLAVGKSVQDLVNFYKTCGEQMFERSALLQRLNCLYTADPLCEKLKEVFGEQTTLAPPERSDQPGLKCLLMAVTKNVTTDSPWPVSSNPDAKYNDPKRRDCNLKIPLWQLVRASTAAPVFFPPEVMQWDPNDSSKTFVFADGGITPYNNPSFLLYRMATEPMYRLNWKTGERNLLLISIGTGAAESLGATAAAPNKNIISTVAGLPGELMYGSSIDQDINCRTVGRCTYGAVLDREILDLVPRQWPSAADTTERDANQPLPLESDQDRRFLYARYNADLSKDGLKQLGFMEVDPSQIQKMDAIENIDTLYKIGSVAGAAVKPEHFGPLLEL